MQRARLSAQHTRAATRLATIEERNRLAREIHDTLAQGLAAISLQLETADALAESRPERAHTAIQRALTLARSNLEEARRSVMDLRAAPLQKHTLPEALESSSRSPLLLNRPLKMPGGLGGGRLGGAGARPGTDDQQAEGDPRAGSHSRSLA